MQTFQNASNRERVNSFGLIFLPALCSNTFSNPKRRRLFPSCLPTSPAPVQLSPASPWGSSFGSFILVEQQPQEADAGLIPATVADHSCALATSTSGKSSSSVFYSFSSGRVFRKPSIFGVCYHPPSRLLNHANIGLLWWFSGDLHCHRPPCHTPKPGFRRKRLGVG